MQRPASISTYSIFLTARRTTSITTTALACPATIRPQDAVTARRKAFRTSTSIPWSRAPCGWRSSRAIEEAWSLLGDGDQGHGIDQAVGQHEVAVLRHVRVANDVAAARDRPALELLRLGIEAHDGVRPRLGLAVPDDVVDRRDAVGRGLGPARRRPFGHLAGRGVETAQVAARVVGVPDDVVARDRDAPRTGSRIRQGVLADLERLRIDPRHLVDTEL